MLLRDEEQVSHPKELRTYRIYGILIRSQWQLPCPQATDIDCLPSVELSEGSDGFFSDVHNTLPQGFDSANWLHHQQLPDSSIYLRWAGLFEFVVSSDGYRIICRAFPGAPPEPFQAYLLGHVLSFALLKQGTESLHSTAVVIDGQAVAFLGNCGYGKSSLAAAFLREGYPLLTDDVLVVKEETGCFFAQPGLPRIKLFPEVAQGTLGPAFAGVPMNPSTSKLILPLSPALSCSTPVPLRALYILRPQKGIAKSLKVSIRTLRQRQGCLALIGNTFNDQFKQPDRLTHQFRFAAKLSSSIVIRSLSYPRSLSRLPDVVRTIQSNLSRS